MKTPLSVIYSADFIFAFSQAEIKAVDLVCSGLLQVFATCINLAIFCFSFVFSGFLMRHHALQNALIISN